MSATPANPALQSTNRGFAPPVAGNAAPAASIYALDDFERRGKAPSAAPGVRVRVDARPRTTARCATNRAAFDDYA